MKNFLVGVDFNEQTEELIMKAQEIAERFNAKLWLLHAVAPVTEYVDFEISAHYAKREQEQTLENERKILDKHVNSLKSSGIDAEGVLIKGATIEAILDESQKLNVDLIICGHHEHNLLYNIIFRSVSTAIVRRSHIPVLVFPLL